MGTMVPSTFASLWAQDESGSESELVPDWTRQERMKSQWVTRSKDGMFERMLEVGPNGYHAVLARQGRG